MPLAPLGPNSRNENTIRSGSVVEYEQHGKPVLASAIVEQKGKWQVKNEDGSESEIASSRLYLYPPLPPALQNSPLKDLADKALQSGASIDLEKVWEHCGTRKREYGVQELALLIFGNDTFFSHLSTRRALINDRVYFKRGKSGFEPRPAEQAAELRKRAEMERERAERRDNLHQALLGRIRGEKNELPPEIEWLELIAATGRAGDDHREAMTVFNDAAAVEAGTPPSGPLDERVFQFLVRIGHFSPDQNLSFLRCRRPVGFDKALEEEAAKALQAAALPPEADRLDMRSLPAIAVDNQDTRDVDDALSLEKQSSGWRLGIHISDVSQAIRPGTELFKEVLYRATTVYCVDSTAPMLPEQLSEGALSLLAGCDRRSVSFLLELDSELNIKKRTIARSVIRVAGRYSYDQVDRLLFDGPEKAPEFDQPTAEMIMRLWDIAAHSETERIGRGAVQMPRRELFPAVGPNGEITFAESGEDTPAHRLVGELMILANETAGLFARDNRIPLAFRGQEPPDQPIEDAVAQTPDGPAREYHRRGMLKRSTVTTAPAPHFGLGVEAYAQATSPIRRAGDLINQEQITSFLHSGRPRFAADELAEMFERLEGGLDEAQLIQRQRRRYFLIKHLIQTGKTELTGTIVRTDGPRPLIELDGTCSIFVFNPNKGVIQSGEAVTVLDRARNGQRITVRISKADPRKELLYLDEI